MTPVASSVPNVDVAEIADFFKDSLYPDKITFGVDPRVPQQTPIKNCQLLSSEGFKRIIPLHRINHYQVLLCLAGHATVTLGLNRYELHRNMLCCLYPGQTNQFSPVAPDLHLLSVAFTQDFYLAGNQPLTMLYKFPFLQYDGLPAFELSEEQASAMVVELYQLDEVYNSGYALREEVLRLGISKILHTANYRHGQLTFQQQPQFATIGTVLTNRFIHLVCQHHAHQRRVATYADMLAVTPNHLNETVKYYTGKTCSELINTMLVQEAKILLRQTVRSITEIANELNFQDLSHFTKYFKKYSGFTPVEFRQVACDN